ncbi:MAG: glutamyl-tRNA reductase [Polyangiales bacterium]
MTSRFVVVGVNHKSAPIETRERVAVSFDGLDDAVRAVKSLPGVREAMMVATCNRVEVYASGDDLDAVSNSLRTYFDHRGATAYVYEHRGDAGIKHAFRVAASLDSLVPGDAQILGQVKEAYGVARDARCAGQVLGRVMPRAFQAARRVRSETTIGQGQVSIASVAVDLAKGIFGDLTGRQVVVLGAGKMALGAARSLVRHGAKLAVANRSYDKAVALAKEHGAAAHPLTDLPLLLQHGDVIVCSTGASTYVVGHDDVQKAMKGRRGRSLFLIDIAVPRNVEPRVGDLDNVYLYNIDDLDQIVTEGSSTRAAATAAAEKVLHEELESFRGELRARGAAPVITALRTRFKATAKAELERSLAKPLKHLGADERKSLEVMLDAMVNKLLHAPTIALRKQADTPEGARHEEALRALFDLADDENPTETA